MSINSLIEIISLPFRETVQVTGIKQDMNDKDKRSRLHYLERLVRSILFLPIEKVVVLTYRTVYLLTWVPAKAGLYKVRGNHAESAAFFEKEYLKTVQAVRDILFIPSVTKRAFQDMVVKSEQFVDDTQQMETQDYLTVPCTKEFDSYSSYLHGYSNFEIIRPLGVEEFPARSDAALRTIMVSHFFKPDMMAINFGCPNVAAFVTEKKKDGTVQTVKVDAKSLRRAAMSYHPTNGKIQSGVFFVPTNLPEKALKRFKEAAKKLEGRRDITCVNTNCRVLKEAGFSIEGVEMDEIIFPKTLVEHLLFRNVFYTDSAGQKHKVHFNILNTTGYRLEEYFEKVDRAVIGTRLRHRRRNADTEENRAARQAAGRKLIAQEKKRLSKAPTVRRINAKYLGRRKVTISIPSCFGKIFTRIWGRHTIYEVDLSDKRDEIVNAFRTLVAQGEKRSGPLKLRPFPQQKPSFGTKLKKSFLFSKPVIWFLRRHMLGRAETVQLNAIDLMSHLRSTEGGRLNYALVDNKVVFAKVSANGNCQEKHRKLADWALSKHALLAGRQDVYCSGEIWYDRDKQCFMINNDSGTYEPSADRIKIVAKLANTIFNTKRFGYDFKVAAIAA